MSIGGLGGLTLASFLIALAASSGSRATPAAAPQDAAAPVVPVRADAALPLAPPPVDAAPVPTVPTVPLDAAAAAATATTAHLIVRTIPDGATIKVGEQSIVAEVQPGDPTGAATVRLDLAPGPHDGTAELDGYKPETRTVVLDKGEQKRLEITFTKQMKTKGPMGRLTVRTTPWSDVYLGGKKLGQAPFEDLPLPAGTHTQTFNKPSRPVVTKTVTIKSNKPTKLTFNL
jgi:serine/threonine-protein kinase